MSNKFPGVAAQGMNMMATAPMICFENTHVVKIMQTMQRLGLAARDTVYIHLQTSVSYIEIDDVTISLQEPAQR